MSCATETHELVVMICTSYDLLLWKELLLGVAVNVLF